MFMLRESDHTCENAHIVRISEDLRTFFVCAVRILCTLIFGLKKVYSTIIYID
jgi:hypothetical protein